jgi:hypothetical protein
MSVYVDPRLWRRSNYVRPERRVKKCGVCGCRIRGENHEQGTAHINRVKAK